MTTASVSPPANAAGWHRVAASITLTATDESGGSGVKEIRFSLSGAERGGGVVPGGEAAVLISAEGTTTVTYFATDNAGNQEAPKTLTIRIDRTPPSVACVRAVQRKDKHDEGEGEGRPLFRVTASDTLSQVATITLGDIELTNGEIIRIHSTERPGVQVVLKTDDDDRDVARIRRFRVGPGSNVIKATDIAGNVGSAVCPLSQRDDDDSDGGRAAVGAGQKSGGGR